LAGRKEYPVETADAGLLRWLLLFRQLHRECEAGPVGGDFAEEALDCGV
jgi:hypothetical protein